MPAGSRGSCVRSRTDKNGDPLPRRRFLGGFATVGIGVLAGCTDDSGSDDEEDGDDGGGGGGY